MSTTAPEISFVVVTDTFATVRKVVDHLCRQTARAGLELVLVTPSRAALALDEGACAGLHGVEVVECDIAQLHRARAHGVAAATAPIVVLGETHAYPEPEYAEALIAAHRGPWAVVGPTVLNANPRSMLGWAALFLDYGPWIDHARGGALPDVPAHNGSYKRSVLLAYGPELESRLRSDTLLNADLRSKGHRLYLEPRARVLHLNVSTIRGCLLERVVAGRAFAASRSESWSPIRRAAYALGWPLIPAVRLGRTLGYLRRSGHASTLLPRLLPALGLALVASAFGELLGYTLGLGGALRPLYDIELHRERYTRVEASA
jgi:hypothetical protein